MGWKRLGLFEGAKYAEIVLEVCVAGKDPNLIQFFHLLGAVLGAYYPPKPARVLL